MTENAAEKIRNAFEKLFSDKRTVVKALSIILILLLAVIMRIHEADKADITIESADTAETSEYREDSISEAEMMFVDIGGAVKDPGVYQVDKNTRLYTVIEMAGGLSEDADVDSINRASYVEDGQKIIIPVKGSDSAGDSTAVSSSATDSGSGLININTASADELKTLSGIGDVMAGRIIEYRNSHPFKNKEDLMSVEGIGSKTYEKIKEDITI